VLPVIPTEPPAILVAVLLLRPNVVVVAVDVPSESVVAESIDGQPVIELVFMFNPLVAVPAQLLPHTGLPLAFAVNTCPAVGKTPFNDNPVAVVILYGSVLPEYVVIPSLPY